MCYAPNLEKVEKAYYFCFVCSLVTLSFVQNISESKYFRLLRVISLTVLVESITMILAELSGL